MFLQNQTTCLPCVKSMVAHGRVGWSAADNWFCQPSFLYRLWHQERPITTLYWKGHVFVLYKKTKIRLSTAELCMGWKLIYYDFIDVMYNLFGWFLWAEEMTWRTAEPHLRWCSPGTRGTGLWQSAAPSWTSPPPIPPTAPAWTGRSCCSLLCRWSVLVRLALP